jgi:plastocyanin
MSHSLTYIANAQHTHNVIIQDFAFHPQILIIQAGDAVTWMNNDTVIYTLWFVYAENQTTYKKGLSEPILPGEKWSWTFDEPVKLQYYSFERLWITGNITVTSIPVGGLLVPVDKFGLLAPYMGLASILIVAAIVTVIYVKHVNRRKEKQ